MQLPTEVRESLIVMLDEYFENENDSPDVSELANFIVRSLETIAEEAGVDDAEEILTLIEEEVEMEEPLTITLEEELGRNDDLELTGEDVVAFLATVCSLSWDEEEEFEDLDDFDEIDDLDDDEEL